MINYYNYRAGEFSLRRGFLGWQWRKKGVVEWSKLYSSRESAEDSIDFDFPREPVQIDCRYSPIRLA